MVYFSMVISLVNLYMEVIIHHPYLRALIHEDEVGPSEYT